MLASLSHVSKAYGEQEILKDVSAVVHEDSRIGLVGSNGAGKSTLISVLLGRQEADAGEVYLNGNARVGYLAQGTGLEAERTVMAEMRGVFEHALQVQKRIEELSAQMSADPENVQLQRSYDAAMSEFMAADGYAVDVKIRRTLTGMGFGPESDDTVISTMSGGEKTRLALARLLLQEPDFLVLDEPTNHLDMATLTWLEGYLQDYKGALLVVSHDRFFLDRVATSVWDLGEAALELYKGNYTAYRVQKKERTAARLKEYEKQQERRVELEDYVRRNIARASTASMARSREKTLEKMEVIKKPRLSRRAPNFSFHAERRPWSLVLAVENGTLSVGKEDRLLAEGISFEVHRGEKVAILGPNGSGKTTFLRRLLDAVSGSDPAVAWGRGVEIGYYDQENRDLKSSATALQSVQSKLRGTSDGEARSLLGRVLLTGEDAFKQVDDLSGGERAKLGLAILMGQGANTLLLDEPTNHLDLDAREALEEALRTFDGTVLFVSHDRYFVNALSEKMLAFENGHVQELEGNYDAYAEHLQQSRQTASKADATGSASKVRGQKENRRIQAERRQRLFELESRLTELEAEEKELKEIISDSPSDYEALSQACARLEEVSSESEEVLAQWLAVSEEPAG